MPNLDPMILKLALVPWEPVLFLVAVIYYMRAWSRIAAGPEVSGGEAALGWRHGAQAISVSLAGTLVALALLAATLLGLAGGATVDLLPKGMTVLQVIVLMGAFDAVVATGAAAVSVAVTPRWMRLEDQLKDRAVLLRLMTARSWLLFALVRLVMAGALMTMDPAAGLARVSGGGAPVTQIQAFAERLTGMQARIDEIAEVTLPALTTKLDETAKQIEKAAAGGSAWPDRELDPKALRLRSSVDRLRDALKAEITAAPASGALPAGSLGPPVATVLESFLGVLEADSGQADPAKAETVRALLAVLEPLAGRLGVKAMAGGEAGKMVAPAALPAAVTFSFPSGVRAVPEKTDAGQPLAEALDGLTAFIRRHPGCLAVVEGHADAKGREDANLLLSLERAESAAGPLLERLDAAHVFTIPRGERQLLVKTKDGMEHAENRRVRIGVQCPGPLQAPTADKMAMAN